MQVTGLGWLGMRTPDDAALTTMLTEVLGLTASHPEPHMTVLELADGAKVEVFGPGFPGKDHFVTGPVAGFWVDDLPGARAELARRGVPLLGEPGPSWQHFRAPGGFVLELLAR